MRHGYTNRTVADAAHVEKTYQGPDASRRLARERDALSALRGLLPVPVVDAVRADGLILRFLPGDHGQDLIERGHARDVLRACGSVLRRLHELPVSEDLFGPPDQPGQILMHGVLVHSIPVHGVLVHGDFGPNNVLLDPATFAVTGVLDWEFAHFGAPVEDLAWCEWIVRAHHPAHRDALGEFFSGYGAAVPGWAERQAAMVDRCAQLEEFCRAWDPLGPGVQLWRERAAAAARWHE